MTFYAIKNGNRVLRVEEYDSPPAEPHAILENWDKFPSGGGEGKVLTEDNGVFQWIDARSINEVKETKNTMINSWRLKANDTYFVFNNKQIAYDAISKWDIAGINDEVALTGQLPPDFPGAWKAIDNTFVLIPDVAAWKAFVRARVAQGTANFVYAQELKSRLAAASTIEEVEAITWETDLGLV